MTFKGFLTHTGQTYQAKSPEEIRFHHLDELIRFVLVHIVDDDDAVRESAALLLEIAGYNVLTYASGVVFLEAVATASPGCVLLDIHMPQMTGLQLANEVRARRPGMPIIIATGYAELPTGDQSFPKLDKPFFEQQLAQAIKAAMQTRQTLPI